MANSMHRVRFAITIATVLALVQRPVASFGLSVDCSSRSRLFLSDVRHARCSSRPHRLRLPALRMSNTLGRSGGGGGGLILEQQEAAVPFDTATIDGLQRLPDRALFQGALASLAIITAAAYDLEFASVPVAASLFALVFSIVTVSAGTAVVERFTASIVPPFDPAAQRFDQSDFGGRFCRMLLECDPRLLLYTEDEVRQCHALVQHHANVVDGTPETDRLLWEARRIVDSGLHPTTGDWIPRPFRMAGYLPYNGPICIAMVAAHSTLGLLFWSWLNQSQNASVNYYNANGSSTMTVATIAKSYAIAVGSALVVAFGLATYVNGHCEGEELTFWLRFISFPSAVIASSLNCYIVRRPEIASGVPLLNAQMENVLEGATSVAAAKRGVYSTTASRAVLQMPTYLIPSLLISTVEPLKVFLAENPSSVVPVMTALLLLSFGLGLPAAVGMFPQMSKLGADEAEEKFQGLGYEEFYFNKGL